MNLNMPGPFTTVLGSRTVIAPGIVDLVFAMVKPSRLEFQAGQFASLGVGRDADGAVVRRSYSIASPSRQGQSLRFIVRIVEGGTASAYLMGLPVGAEIEMTGPHGFFVLDREHPGDIVFCATGTGIAPVLPMLDELSERPETGRRFVYWGLRHAADVFARDDVEAACARAQAALHLFLSRPPDSWSGPRGRITGAVLEALPSLRAPTFYLVGNGAMIEDLKRQLVARGVDRKRQIRTEVFF